MDYDAATDFGIGERYMSGDGLTKSADEAVKWFRKAADKGHAEAQFNLGGCYKRGEGVAKDLTEAARWYRKAAE